MKILIITQSVNKNNPVLGFFHRWIEEFSKNFESVVVICLEKGEYSFPKNVKVLSLGKENSKLKNSYFRLFQKVRYILIFWKYIWMERKNYDAVFVHMNQEYVLLGWKLWFLTRKKIYMWRNHGKGSILTDLAAFFCKKVFCTSKFSYTAKYKKTVLMPVGIDTDFFKPRENIKRKKNSILFLGRIAPVKNPHLLIEAVAQIKNISWNLSIVGDPLPKDQKYYQELQEKCRVLGIESKVSFQAGVPNDKTPEIYSEHEIFVNLSPNGMLDKTIFEAMACECLILASNENLRVKISDNFILKEDDIKKMSDKIINLLSLTEEEKETAKKDIRKFIKDHSLKILSKIFFQEIIHA